MFTEEKNFKRKLELSFEADQDVVEQELKYKCFIQDEVISSNMQSHLNQNLKNFLPTLSEKYL